MSFNVRYDTDADGPNAWPERRDLVADTIHFHRPDVVGLQEPLRHQLRYLQRELDAYEWVGGGRLDGHEEGEFCPVGFRAGRFDLLDRGTFWLSETPDEPGSVGWDASYARVATWARLRDRATDAPLVAASTHLDHDGQTARRQGVEVLLERLDAVADGVPVVVTADFNCGPEDAPYRAMTGDRDGRAYEAAARLAARGSHGPRATFHGFTGESVDRRDYVFVSGDVGVPRFGVLADRSDDRYPSDHFPLLAELSVHGGE